jgi:hypothetical protein
MGYGRRRVSAGVADAPRHHRPHDWTQVFTFGGQRVLDPRRVLAVTAGTNQTLRGQALQALREDVGRDAFRRVQKLRVATPATHQIADDQHVYTDDFNTEEPRPDVSALRNRALVIKFNRLFRL